MFWIIAIGTILIIYILLKATVSDDYTTSPVEDRQYILEEFDLLVGGVWYRSLKTDEPRQKYLKEIRVYDKIFLEKSPREKHPHAVLVLNDDKIDIGYILSPDDKKITTLLNKGYEYQADVKKTFRKKNEKNCVIIITFYTKTPPDGFYD